MGKRLPKKVLNLGNKDKKTTPKPREPYVYTYCHICKECGDVIKEIKSHKVISEIEGIGVCPQCQKGCSLCSGTYINNPHQTRNDNEEDNRNDKACGRLLQPQPAVRTDHTQNILPDNRLVFGRGATVPQEKGKETL